jgi:hypothetical protein
MRLMRVTLSVGGILATFSPALQLFGPIIGPQNALLVFYWVIQICRRYFGKFFLRHSKDILIVRPWPTVLRTDTTDASGIRNPPSRISISLQKNQ